MNDKGMIITSLLYAILGLFILILFSIVLTVGIRKNLVDVISDKIEAEMDYIPPVINGLNVLPVFTGQTYTAANYAAGLTATDDVDGDVTSSITCVGVNPHDCTAKDKTGNTSAVFKRYTTAVTALTYDYTGAPQLFTAANNGTYQIELWGAQGGSNMIALGGKGAYVKGDIYLTTGQRLYIYVGSSPKNHLGGYNGGGLGGTDFNTRGGGGATDVRLISGDWNNLYSLRSRIMIAAGGSGAVGFSTGLNGSAAGGSTGTAGALIGTGTYTVAGGGTQTSGGVGATGDVVLPGVAGTFGIGGSSTSMFGSGGGAGYYGGGSGTRTSTYAGVGTGGGGSSFISGKATCDAINEDGTHSGTEIHYSGLMFTQISFKTGDDSDGKSYSGFAKITFVSN